MPLTDQIKQITAPYEEKAIYKSTIRHFPGGKYKLTEGVFKGYLFSIAKSKLGWLMLLILDGQNMLRTYQGKPEKKLFFQWLGH